MRINPHKPYYATDKIPADDVDRNMPPEGATEIRIVAEPDPEGDSDADWAHVDAVIGEGAVRLFSCRTSERDDLIAIAGYAANVAEIRCGKQPRTVWV